MKKMQAKPVAHQSSEPRPKKLVVAKTAELRAGAAARKKGGPANALCVGEVK